LIITVVKAIQHQSIPVSTGSEISLALVVAHSIFLGVLCLAIRPVNFGAVLFGAFMARMIALLLDRFSSVELPFLGSPDADGFYLAAVAVSEDLTLAGDTYGGAYTAVLGYLFYLIGPDRLLGQYLNIILSLSTLVILAATLDELRIRPNVKQLVLIVAGFMPLVIAHTSILLRESIIQTLVTAALFCFVRGLKTSQLRWVSAALVLVLCASAFHAGVIGVLIGMSLAFAFTSIQGQKLVFGLRRVTPVVLMVLALVAVLLENPELFLGKFQSLESSDDLLEYGLSGRGGSAYLESLQVDSWWSFFLYAPLRALYFVLAPMPWDWRGINDVLAFGVDSTIYLVVMVLFLSRKIKDPNRRYMALTLAFTLMITCLVFGVGVSNAGTAIRHRGKLLGFFLVLLALVLDSERIKRTIVKRKGSKAQAVTK
jgi:hypothetical protein